MTTTVQIEPATVQDLDNILALLAAHSLPLDGLGSHLATTLLARQADQVVGSAALEMHADGALSDPSPSRPHCRAAASGVG